MKQEQQLLQEMKESWDSLQAVRATWDDKEKALLGQVNDSISGNITVARVTDASLSTLALERQARIAAKLTTGVVYAASQADAGKAKLANIILQRYIIPNASRGIDFLTLLRMWGVYASVYGSMPMFYDYIVDDNYIGPYATLLDPRCFMPEPGKGSIGECEWAMVSSVVPLSFLEGIKERKNTTYNKAAVNKALEQLKKQKGKKPTVKRQPDRESIIKQRFVGDESGVELVTKYEKGSDGRWITFIPDLDGIIIRDIPNPHKSGKIPIVMRHCFPLLGSIYGLGDFERGMRLQKAKDSLTSLFLEGAKLSIYPPKKIIRDRVSESTIRDEAGSKWYVQDMAAIQPYEGGAGRLQEFQSTYSILHTMLMNQFGTTDTTTTADTSGNPAYGKTPRAIRMLQERENARDTWDRFMHEKAVEELYEGMINLLACKMEKPIQFTVFEKEIEQIADENPDVLDMIDKNYGKMVVSKKDIYSKRGFTYVIDAGSSVQNDEEAQNETLIQLLQLGMSPDIQQILMQNGIEWDLAEHIKRIFVNAGISEWDKIFKKTETATVANDYSAKLQSMRQNAQFNDPQIAALADELTKGI